MSPEFEDGSIIVIDPAGVVEDGAYVLALHKDEYIFRQLSIDNGQYLLKAANPGYEAVQLPGVTAIKGIVVQKAGTRKHQRKHYR
jgi:SOS-response transcriptional repressor LexA